jgi:hypothetical protein
MFQFELGEKLRDKIVSGFSGVVMARCEYLTGEIKYGLGPYYLPVNDKIQEFEWLEECRLERIEDVESIKLT